MAYDVVRAVDERAAYANLMLPALLRERGLTGRDAALATELTYGTLRGRGTYDAVLGLCSDRPVAKIDLPLLNVLRLGTHQLLATRIPPHAAVGTAVDLARSVCGPGQAKFANAVLRKVAARDREAWLAIAAPDDPTGRLAVTYSHPAWIVNALRDAVGAGEIEALLAADNERPRVTLVARPGRATAAELPGEPAAYSPYAAYLPEGDPADVPAVREGRAAVQDEASQLVALALTRVEVDGPDARWLDLCAGPGGKAALLSGLAGERGARLLACDVQRHRARLVRGALEPATAPATGPETARATGAETARGTGPEAVRVTGAEAGSATGPESARVTGSEAGPVTGPESARVTGSEAGPATGPETARATGSEAAPTAGSEAARAAGPAAAVAVADGTRPAWRPGTFDRVIADVPCSGLGALRRRPEARWRRGPESIAELGTLQRGLLASALDAVRPGGVVAYVTCSPHLAETRVVVDGVLAGRDDVERLDARTYLEGVSDLGEGPYAQFWPHRHGTDAMFLALLRRR